MNIREIHLEEIPECVRIIRRSFQTVADTLGFTAEDVPRFTAFATTTERLFWQLEHEGRVMVGGYSDSQAVIGYYSLSFQEDGGCELNNLCVLPEHRHGGLGAALLEDALSRARQAGCTSLNIGIVEENAVLKQWYAAHGFVHTGTKKFDFFPFTCGYMEKNLQQERDL